MSDAAPLTLVSAWNTAKRRLQEAGVEGPVIDARMLVEAAAEATRADILADPHRALSPEQQRVLDDFLQRRIAREPISHILGVKGFWKIMLRVTPDVLTPRPDTETLLDAVLPLMPEGQRLRVLDLGVGSGAVLLAILAERPAAIGLGTDVSEEALAVARDNAASLGLAGRAALLRTEWTAGLEPASFDVVVSNPPYIPSGEIETLAPEVRDHEPRLALDGGPDGLDAYRVLAGAILETLKPGGLFAVEFGLGQAPAVRRLFEAAGATDLAVVNDLTARERVLRGRRAPVEVVEDKESH